jgi:iron complex transport system substrate-binding protein
MEKRRKLREKRREERFFDSPACHRQAQKDIFRGVGTMMKICSLLPSATEIVYALGLGDSLVGVTHECDFPEDARSKPVLIRSRVNAEASTGEIDRQVRELMRHGESLYAVDDEALRRIAPDLILTQDLCHVCAASPDDLAAALRKMVNAPQVITLTPRSLTDVWADIRKVGAATERAKEAEALAARLEERVAAVERATAAAPRVRALCLEWLDPPYVAGHWVPEMVAAAGGMDMLGRAAEASFAITWGQAIASQPEVVLVMPCGYGAEKAAAEWAQLVKPAGWETIPAARSGRVHAVDANSYFSRPGPRLADGVEILAKLLHPQLQSNEYPHKSLLATGLQIQN